MLGTVVCMTSAIRASLASMVPRASFHCSVTSSPILSPVARAIRVPISAGISAPSAPGPASACVGMSSRRCAGSIPLMTTDLIRPPGYIVPGTTSTAVAPPALICRRTASGTGPCASGSEMGSSGS